jgi:hypothetical protein
MGSSHIEEGSPLFLNNPLGSILENNSCQQHCLMPKRKVSINVDDGVLKDAFALLAYQIIFIG